MIRVIDFETTGLPPEADVVEAAFVDVCDGAMIGSWTSLVKPTRPISVEARAAHHLSDEEVARGEDWHTTQVILHGGNTQKTFAAHNADFERAFFDPPGSRWVDTYKCALRLWPTSPKHTNQVLRYFLEGCDPGELGMPPHRSLPDCYVTGLVLVRCLERESLDQLIAWSNEPPLLPRVPMGKHFGRPWSEVPTDYLEWAMRQDFDAGVAHTVRVELERRRKGVAG